ncbi:arsenate reductase ArsC [Methylogaea oryzae]|uniref:Protein-tyrosine-phosphatase n=1 Tax=Methylogaea oryzae TaxID=1295382 RepID=A0A8D4VQM2_9GAMM|nr:arsenate reductase ArsC [Methylogaea oryzae]BBL71917.1 protein-tyrosine-phosphatase [Methylogaea oryzae]
MSDKTYNVLFLCTGNSARSILAECLLNRLGQGRFRAYSAGSKPLGRVNPFAVELLQQEGYAVDGLRSKSWDEFSGPDAPHMDFIFTACGNAAGETCPVWPGHPASAHWGIADPAGDDDEAKRAAFRQAYERLHARIARFVALPLESLDAAALKAELDAIGRMEGRQ